MRGLMTAVERTSRRPRAPLRAGAGRRGGGALPAPRHRDLLPEGGLGDPRPGHAGGSVRARVHAGHRRAVSRDARDVGAAGGALRHPDRGRARHAAGPPLGALDRELLRSAQGQAAARHARRRRRLDVGPAPRAVHVTGRHAEAGVGPQARPVEAQPAGRLGRARRVALHHGQRRAVPPAARSRLRVDRLLAVHAGRRWARRAAGPGTPRTNAAFTSPPRLSVHIWTR